MGFGSTRKFSSDQLPNSPTAPVPGTELDGRLRKGSPALTGSRGGGLHRAPCARPPGRRAEGLVPAPRTRSAHMTRARPQRGGGGAGGPSHSQPLRGREVPADVLSGTLRLGGRLSRAVPEPSGLLRATSPLPSSLSEVALAAQHRPPRSLYTGKRGRCYTSGLFSFFSRKLAVKCFPAQWWVRAKR